MLYLLHTCIYRIASNFRIVDHNCIFRIVEHHTKIKTTNISLHIMFYVTMLSCTNI